MQLNVSHSVDNHWDAKIQQLNGNLFHTRQWAATRRSSCSRPVFFELRANSDNCFGIAVGIESWSPAPLIGRFSRQLEFETYPVVVDDRNDLVHTMMRQIIAYAKKRGCRCVMFNSFLTRATVPELADLGVKTEPRIEFVLDLTLSDNQLFADFKTHHKRKIKKALKHNMEFSEASDLEAMRQFRQLQVRSRDRRLERGEQMAVIDDAYYETLGRQYFSANLGKVFMLTHQGQPVSSAFVAYYGRQALYMYGGSSDLGFKMDAPPLLFKHVFTRCRELGCLEFNLGGVPAEAQNQKGRSHGLFRFKAGFGGKQVLCENAVADNLNPGRDKMVHLVKRLLRKQ